jgi:hypothetical protein
MRLALLLLRLLLLPSVLSTGSAGFFLDSRSEKVLADRLLSASTPFSFMSTGWGDRIRPLLLLPATPFPPLLLFRLVRVLLMVRSRLVLLPVLRVACTA